MPKQPLLDNISCLDDFYKINPKDYPRLAEELREFFMESIPRTGGHLASNLGTVEMTIALHHCFRTPSDQIIWDVGHQCYTHKVLTGRKNKFDTLRQFKGISGFPKRSESIHDSMDTGHSSTSISAAIGFSLSHIQNGQRAIAVIGDGSLTGGMAFEGLNYGGHLKRPLIIVINDNEMSISRNIGALSTYLSDLTSKRQNFRFWRKKFKQFVGFLIKRFMTHSSRPPTRNVPRKNLFHMLGYEYIGVVDGHDLHDLINSFSKASKLNRPVVVHVRTIKGKGFPLAESNPTRFHGMSANPLFLEKIESSARPNYSDVFGQMMIRLAQNDPSIRALTAAMVDGTGLTGFEVQFPERLFDTGITEQNTLTIAAGLALGGMKPVVAIYSSFMQRAVDQVIHDVCLQKAPVVIAMDRSGLVGNDGETHQGVFDIALFRAVPNLVFFAPSGRAEMEACLEYGLDCGAPFLFRFPRGRCIPDYEGSFQPIETGRGVYAKKASSDVLLIGVGHMLHECMQASDRLHLAGYSVDVFNLRFIRPLDKEHLSAVLSSYSLVITVEDGVISGGIGQEIALLAAEKNIRTKNLGIPDEFIEQGSVEELKELCGISSASIYNVVVEAFPKQQPAAMFQKDASL